MRCGGSWLRRQFADNGNRGRLHAHSHRRGQAPRCAPRARNELRHDFAWPHKFRARISAALCQAIATACAAGSFVGEQARSTSASQRIKRFTAHKTRTQARNADVAPGPRRDLFESPAVERPRANLFFFAQCFTRQKRRAQHAGVVAQLTWNNFASL